MTDNEIAFRAAINLLRDSVESGKMPSGEKLTAESRALHERAAEHLEELLRSNAQKRSWCTDRRDPSVATRHGISDYRMRQPGFGRCWSWIDRRGPIRG
ncbi:hypothetical protein AWL63_23220 (plasmid) [Sphingomonas panacis]|uniref:Uncharacterized protein n=1 Tax=Sphingomonas panacis TaxID=1560345 RepID=A0A1B3ZI44_9SPHN|nr:hypothetical protein [Sphingomonas panacis]AOH87095.1 hypothetical protein AWL63_23220 [Sphingomonas panacis]